MAEKRLLAALAAILAVAAQGCGIGPGGTPAGVRLSITEDFGSRPVRQFDHPRGAGEETVMRLLQRNANVSTRYGGGFVQSIDGRKGGRRGGRPLDWFFYVNGVESSKGAAAVRVHDGDRVWWDRHDWGAAMRVPAVVGSFPEPFIHGRDGKRLPIRVECAQPAGAGCQTATDQLTKLGVVAAQGGLQRSMTKHSLRVLVGPWRLLRSDDAAAQIERGPQASGVYARMAPDGRSLAVLDARGRVTRTLRAGAGLIAAARFMDGEPVWIVSGTDDKGVSAAAHALSEDALGGRFALAIDGAGVGIGLPELRR